MGNKTSKNKKTLTHHFGISRRSSKDISKHIRRLSGYLIMLGREFNAEKYISLKTLTEIERKRLLKGWINPWRDSDVTGLMKFKLKHSNLHSLWRNYYRAIESHYTVYESLIAYQIVLGTYLSGTERHEFDAKITEIFEIMSKQGKLYSEAEVVSGRRAYESLNAIYHPWGRTSQWSAKYDRL